jgi:hypothetical protein
MALNDDDLPEIPGGNDTGAPQVGQGFRQLLDASSALQSAVRPSRDPITDQTPQSTLRRAVGNARWNFAPTSDGGAAWQSSPGGMTTFHEAPSDFLRPARGPQSAGAVAAGAALTAANPVQVPDVGVPARAPVLSRHGNAAVASTTPPVALAAPAAAVPPQTLLGSPAPATAAPAAAQLAAPSARAGGVTVGGRALGYGAMVNGVPTFSDGSNGIPRTMTDDQIQQLGSRLSRADAGALAQPLASDALGYTPSTEQMVNQRIATLRRNQPITGSRPSAADFAQSEREAIASGDWRSAAGTVAHNLMVDAQTVSRPQRQLALARLQALQGGVNQDEALAGQQATQAAQFENAQNLENLRGQYGLAEGAQRARLAQLTRQGHAVTLADGTLALMDPLTGQITPSRLGSGQAGRALVSKDDAASKRTDALIDQLNKGAQTFAKNWLPSKDQPAPTPEMYQQWRLQSARSMGLPLAHNQAGQYVANINGQWVQI